MRSARCADRCDGRPKNDVVNSAKRELLRTPSLLMRARAQATVRGRKSDRSSKLIRGLVTEAAAGFRSRRGLSYDDLIPSPLIRTGGPIGAIRWT